MKEHIKITVCTPVPYTQRGWQQLKQKNEYKGINQWPSNQYVESYILDIDFLPSFGDKEKVMNYAKEQLPFLKHNYITIIEVCGLAYSEKDIESMKIYWKLGGEFYNRCPNNK